MPRYYSLLALPNSKETLNHSFSSSRFAPEDIVGLGKGQDEQYAIPHIEVLEA